MRPSTSGPSERAPAVRYERAGCSAIVTIDRPQRRNAVDGATAEQLHGAFQRFEADEAARVMVLNGAGGRAFCAGADLTAIESMVARASDPNGPLGFTRLTASKPTIAAIDGWCVAGGLELALWCDLRIATSQSQFGCLERRWGVPLIDGGTQRLPRVVGFGRAMDMILTGRVVASGEALAIGLVSEVVDDGAALERALEIAEALAAYPQETLLADRMALYGSLDRELRAGLELEAQLATGTLKAARGGARRFAEGAGRGGAGSAV